MENNPENNKEWTLWDELPDGPGTLDDSRDQANRVNYLQSLEGGPVGYRLRRVILCNFWLYGLQEFEIPHGRLFLAGENASGKSSVLAAALPLALDGNLSPTRLDTFGGRQRKIDYYVLGSAESSTPYQFDRRTTYIALEFEWCNPHQPPIHPELRQQWLEARTTAEREKSRWLTIGLSLAGNINANEKVRPVRFLVTDGSRFGHELRMVDRHNVAYDQPTFKRLLSEGARGIVCDTVAEYQAQVAAYLFGIKEVQDFRHIINMMMEIRRPNLGTEINFVKVHDYLKQALPRIPDEITRRVTGTLERMDNIQTQLENLQEAYAAAGTLDKASQKLALAMARRSGLTYLLEYKDETGFQTVVTSLENRQTSARTSLENAEAAFAGLNTEAEQIIGQLTALEASESLQLVEKAATTRSQAQEAARQFEQTTRQLANARQNLQGGQNRQVRLNDQHREWQTETHQQLTALISYAGKEAEWPLVVSQLEGWERELASFGLQTQTPLQGSPVLLALAGPQSEERLARLAELEELHQEQISRTAEVQNAAEKSAERLGAYDELRQRRDSARERVGEMRAELAQNWRQLQREAESWLGTLPDYRLAGLTNQALQASIEDYRLLVQSVRQELERAVRQLAETYQRDWQEIGGHKTRLAELQRLFEQKKAEPDRLPLRTAGRQAARTLLAQHQIEARPFYALVDFKPGLSSEQGGQVETMLEEAGLLDALVIRHADLPLAQEVLATHNLSDAFLRPGEMSQTAANKADLTGWLTFAPPTPTPAAAWTGWQPLVEELLRTLPVTAPQAEKPLEWQHGLLTGRVEPRPAPGFIGLANRERLRREELAALETRLHQAQTELNALESRARQNQEQRERLDREKERLEQLYRAEKVAAAEETHDRLETERHNAERILSETQTRERELRQVLNAVIARILQASADIPGAARDQRKVRALREAVRHLKSEALRLQQSLTVAVQRWHEQQELQASLEAALSMVQLSTEANQEAQSRLTRTQSELAELENVMAEQNLQTVVERLALLKERSRLLPQELQKAAAERGKAEEKLRGLLENLDQARQNLDEARQKRHGAEDVFLLRMAYYPAAELLEARSLAERGNVSAAARTLLGIKEAARANANSGETWTSSVPSEEELTNAYNQANGQLMAEFNRQRSFLLDYGPNLNLDEDTRIIFLAEDQIEIPGLLNILADRIELQKTLLAREESNLFENFLLQEMAEAIRSHIQKANSWLQNINQVLNNLPMVGERYALEWKPLDPNDINEGSGSHIARHHRLLSKPVQNLTQEERQLIQDALRLEIDGLRLRLKSEPSLSFMEALIQIFDYREWFLFSIFITPQGGNRVHLTDRNAGTRSGAEQLFALYVPLFSALAALYSGYAAPGSPHLLALDEAFDKASLSNTRKIMEFLVLQDFQWMMTGPQVSGVGSGVPASAEYQMLHEKGTNVATALPLYWIGGQMQLNED